MKRLCYILVLLSLTIPTFGRLNKSSGGGHYAGLYVEGAYSNIHSIGQNVQPTNGYGVGGGVLYEYEWNNLMFNVGCGFVWQQGGYKLNGIIRFEDREVIDTQGTPYTLHTFMERSDIIKRGAIEIPIMFGGNIGALYMLGGVKIGATVLDRTQLCADITTYGEYDRYIIPISQTSNHGFRTYVPVEQRSSFAGKFDVRLSFEIGANLGVLETKNDANIKARLGLFVDYGVFAKQFQMNTSFVENREGNYDFDTYQLQPIMVNGSSAFIENGLVGIKLTVLIGSGQAKSTTTTTHCKTCHLSDVFDFTVKHKGKCMCDNDD